METTTIMAPNPPNRDDPDRLLTLVQELETAFTQLLMLIEQSLDADPETQASQALAFEGQIQELQAETRARMDMLGETITPWDQRRALFPDETAERVDRFLALLEKGLTAIQTRVGGRVEEIEQRRDAIRETLDDLKKKRQGVQGYRPKNAPARFFDKKV